VFPVEKVILEYQGADHLDPDRYRSDMTRISRLEADGWYVIQVNADDLRNPDELLRRVRRVLLTRPTHL
jgi:very-short-patch-repair endonuclease